MLLGGEEVTVDFRKILGYSVKHVSLGIPNPGLSVECAYNTSKADSRELVDYLLGGYVFNYVGHRACVRNSSQTARLRQKSVELADIFKRKDQAGVQEKNLGMS